VTHAGYHFNPYPKRQPKTVRLICPVCRGRFELDMTTFKQRQKNKGGRALCCSRGCGNDLRFGPPEPGSLREKRRL
jgi:hypothetical protein